jgi:hypothetical protein
MPGQQYWDTVLNNAAVAGQRIYGWTHGGVPLGETRNCPYVTVVDVVRDGKRIRGSVTAISASDRMRFALSYYLEVKKR